MRQGITRVERDRPLEHLMSLLVVVVGIAPEVGQAAQHAIIGRQTDGRLAQRLLKPCILDPPDER